jgi:regulatory protein
MRRAMGAAVSSNEDPPRATLGRRRPERQWDEASLDAAAQRYLARFSSSAENLRRILLRKADDAALVDVVVERCRRRGFVDDRAYATARSASLRRAGASARAIEERLRQKGVEREIIRAALAEAPPEIEAAVALARRRRLGPFRRTGHPAEFREKDLAAFARAGFSLETAREVLGCASAEEAEALTPS